MSCSALRNGAARPVAERRTPGRCGGGGIEIAIRVASYVVSKIDSIYWIMNTSPGIYGDAEGLSQHTYQCLILPSMAILHKHEYEYPSGKSGSQSTEISPVSSNIRRTR